MRSAVLLLSLLALVASGSGQEEAVEAAAAPEAAAEAGEEAVAAAGEEGAAAEGSADAAEVKATETTEEPACGKCPAVSTQHYKAKQCTPVMDLAVDKCCPARYECASEEALGVALTSCFYKNQTFEVGADIPVVGPCRRGCQCKKSLDPEEPAKIECGIIECPSSLGAPKPGCRGLFSNDECCEVDLECSAIIPESEVASENVTIRSADCFADGLEYYLGDKIFFRRSPCQQCVCSEEFSGAHGPNCITIDCGMEYRDRLYLRNGCTPLYQNGTCCPTDWICPDSPQLIYDSSRLAKGDEDPTTHCTLGKVLAPRGESLITYNCHVSCQCITPPDFTCVQYTSCPLAVAAQNANDAP